MLYREIIAVFFSEIHRKHRNTQRVQTTESRWLQRDWFCALTAEFDDYLLNTCFKIEELKPSKQYTLFQGCIVKLSIPCIVG